MGPILVQRKFIAHTYSNMYFYRHWAPLPDAIEMSVYCAANVVHAEMVDVIY